MKDALRARVLMVTREWPQDRRFGLGRSLAPLLAPMGERGVEVRYFCQEDIAPSALQAREERIRKLGALPFVRGRTGPTNLMRAWVERLDVGAAAARVAAREAYTHVHAHDPWLAVGVAWTLRRLGARHIRWGFTQHGFGSYSRATHEDGLLQGPRMQAWMHRIERAMCRRAAFVTAPTQLALDRLAADLSLASQPANWHCVPHARPDIEPASTQQRAHARAQLGFADGDILVLAVGRLVPLKRFDRVIEACASLGDPRLHLLLLGSGDTESLQQLARAKGLAHLRIESADDVRPYYHAADLYISASSTESFGLANLEALCAGLPAICTAVGGVPEVVDGAAWLIAPETDTLAPALREWVASPAARMQWAQRATQRGREWPDAQQIADRYVALYQAT